MRLAAFGAGWARCRKTHIVFLQEHIVMTVGDIRLCHDR